VFFHLKKKLVNDLGESRKNPSFPFPSFAFALPEKICDI
jgi:hypothetical protein